MRPTRVAAYEGTGHLTIASGAGPTGFIGAPANETGMQFLLNVRSIRRPLTNFTASS
jgi:hypothetical protein